MNTYQITQITYAGSSKRHTEKWIVKAWRAPTADEIRARLKISIQDRILVAEIDFPIWDLHTDKDSLNNGVRRYLGKSPHGRLHPDCFNINYLHLLKERYGAEIILHLIEELT